MRTARSTKKIDKDMIISNPSNFDLYFSYDNPISKSPQILEPLSTLKTPAIVTKIMTERYLKADRLENRTEK
jgi:hypothetical protein